MNVDKAVDYVVSCMNFDGGFGCRPGSESHSGQVRKVCVWPKKIANKISPNLPGNRKLCCVRGCCAERFHNQRSSKVDISGLKVQQKLFDVSSKRPLSRDRY